MSNIEGSELATGRVRPIGGPDWQFSCKDSSERPGSGASFKVEISDGRVAAVADKMELVLSRRTGAGVEGAHRCVLQLGLLSPEAKVLLVPPGVNS